LTSETIKSFNNESDIPKVQTDQTTISNNMRFDTNEDFEGWGPTVTAEGRLPIGCRPLALVGNLRGSLLFGDQKFSNTAQMTRGEKRDVMMQVIESQVGLEYRRCFLGGIISARALLEGQYWALGEAGYSGDLGFFGGTFGIQYAR
jgi:hypothetical protein